MHIETLPPADLPFVTREATVRDNVALLALDAACRMGAGRWSAWTIRHDPDFFALFRVAGVRAHVGAAMDGAERVIATVTIVEQPIVGDKGIDTAFYVSGWQVHPAHRSSGLGRRMHDVLQCGGARLADTETAHQSRILLTDIPASGLRLRGHGAFYIQLRRWADDGHERIGISGRVTQVAADSVLVRVAELRDSTGPTLRYEPQRETWLVRGLGVVEARNTDTGRTLIMVVLAAATVAAVIAAANAPQPTPKPSGGGLLLVALGEHGRHYKRRVHLARAGAMSITSPPRLSMHERPWTRMRAACRGRVVRTHPAASIVRAKSTER